MSQTLGRIALLASSRQFWGHCRIWVFAYSFCLSTWIRILCPLCALQTRKPGAYSFWTAYPRTKLANILFALELRKRLAADGSRIVVVSLHPGAIKKNIWMQGWQQKFHMFVHVLFVLFVKVFLPCAGSVW